MQAYFKCIILCRWIKFYVVWICEIDQFRWYDVGCNIRSKMFFNYNDICFLTRKRVMVWMYTQNNELATCELTLVFPEAALTFQPFTLEKNNCSWLFVKSAFRDRQLRWPVNVVNMWIAVGGSSGRSISGAPWDNVAEIVHFDRFAWHNYPVLIPFTLSFPFSVFSTAEKSNWHLVRNRDLYCQALERFLYWDVFHLFFCHLFLLLQIFSPLLWFLIVFLSHNILIFFSFYLSFHSPSFLFHSFLVFKLIRK